MRGLRPRRKAAQIRHYHQRNYGWRVEGRKRRGEREREREGEGQRLNKEVSVCRTHTFTPSNAHSFIHSFMHSFITPRITTHRIGLSLGVFARASSMSPPRPPLSSVATLVGLFSIHLLGKAGSEESSLSTSNSSIICVRLPSYL